MRRAATTKATTDPINTSSIGLVVLPAATAMPAAHSHHATGCSVAARGGRAAGPAHVVPERFFHRRAAAPARARASAPTTRAAEQRPPTAGASPGARHPEGDGPPALTAGRRRP